MFMYLLYIISIRFNMQREQRYTRLDLEHFDFSTTFSDGMCAEMLTQESKSVGRQFWPE